MGEAILSASDEMRIFTIKTAELANAGGSRLGTLSIRGRAAIDTPNYIAISSRGVVPHLSQDMMERHTGIHGVYTALEDFIEKAPPQIPPVYQLAHQEQTSALRRFIALPNSASLILGARRSPPVPSPVPNTNSAVSILTSVGFRQLSSKEYAEAARMLRPDIVVGLGDLVHGAKPGSRRIEKMGHRTLAWMNQLVQELQVEASAENSPEGRNTYIFAPIHPVPCELQKGYLDTLAHDLLHDISGIAVYESSSVVGLSDPLNMLPRLSLSEPANPYKLLSEVFVGVDVFTVPFISAATDAGIALDFTFPPTMEDTAIGRRNPLGIDMWQSYHATSIAPLQRGCECYACTRHHRAYLQHLLSAKEMLGWVLLQVHNHHVLDDFFAGVRASIANGSFEEDMAAFDRTYERELPEKTGQGPRVRGYQFKSEGPGELKKNARAYYMLDEGKEKLEESSLPSPNADAKDLEDHGFGTALGS